MLFLFRRVDGLRALLLLRPGGAGHVCGLHRTGGATAQGAVPGAAHRAGHLVVLLRPEGYFMLGGIQLHSAALGADIQVHLKLFQPKGSQSPIAVRADGEIPQPALQHPAAGGTVPSGVQVGPDALPVLQVRGVQHLPEQFLPLLGGCAVQPGGAADT